MRIISAIRPKVATQIPEPPIARFLFADTRMAWFWLIVRLYVGYQWLVAGLDKLTGHDYSIGSNFGKAVKGGAWVFTSVCSSDLLCKRGDLFTAKMVAHPLDELLSGE